MKTLLTVFLCFYVLFGEAQKNVSLSASGNFNFATNNLITNDAGIGVSLDANFFSQKKIQLRLETSLDHFIGSKLLTFDAMGSQYTGNPTMLSFKAGPEYFFVKSVSIAALYGYVAYHWFDHEINDDGLKFILTGHFGKQHKMLTSLYHSTVLKAYPVNYFGVSVGYKVF